MFKSQLVKHERFCLRADGEASCLYLHHNCIRLLSFLRLANDAAEIQATRHSSAGGAESHLSREPWVHAPRVVVQPVVVVRRELRTNGPTAAKPAVVQRGSVLCNLALRARFWWITKYGVPVNFDSYRIHVDWIYGSGGENKHSLYADLFVFITSESVASIKIFLFVFCCMQICTFGCFLASFV